MICLNCNISKENIYPKDYCYKCSLQRKKDLYYRSKAKLCKICNNPTLLNQFSRLPKFGNRKTKERFSRICNNCVKTKCCKCLNLKPNKDFTKYQLSKKKKIECKTCCPRKKSEKNKIYNQMRNKDPLFRKKATEYAKKRNKERRKTDIQFRLKCNLRNRLYFYIKGKVKVGSAIKDLGCTVEELKIHLEKQFKEGMSWENYGNKNAHWSVDHILPMSRFDLTNREQLVKACNYMNLQPMWHIENIKKGNKTIF
jgi:hypothetical protein